MRNDDWSGDVLGVFGEAHGGLMIAGERTEAGRRTLTEAAAHFESQWSQLPSAVKSLQSPAMYPVEPSEGLLKLTEEVDGNIR
jgi:hypothetical protein